MVGLAFRVQGVGLKMALGLIGRLPDTVCPGPPHVWGEAVNPKH